MSSEINIAWALVNYGPIFSPVYETHMRAMGIASRDLQVNYLGKMGGMAATDRMYTHTAENQVVKDFLANPELTHLFMTESDMLLPDDTIPKLARMDKDIASGLYFLRNGDGQPCLYRKSIGLGEEGYGQTPVRLFPQDKPFKLNGCCGLGCVLIHRNVFEKVPYPWFDLKEGGYGSDMFFYHQVRKYHFQVWVDPTITCGQIEYTVWGIHDYHTRIERDPEFAAQGAIIGLEDYEGPIGV